MQCPKDLTSLKKISRYGVVIDECKKCSGVWLDANEIQHLAYYFSTDEKNEFKKLSERKTMKTTMPKVFWNESKVHCPKDNTLLKRHYFGGNSGIGIEQCLMCRGFWLDGGELESIRTVVAPNQRLDMAVAGFADAHQREMNWKYDPGVEYMIEVLSKPEVAARQTAEKALEVLKILLVRIVLKI